MLFTLNAIIIYVNYIFFSDCLPISSNDRNLDKIVPSEMMQFMQTYGYLPRSSINSESLYHEDAISAAIKNVQKFGAIEQTGVLDANTLKLVTAPRCGVPDINLNRAKRYVIGSRGWNKRNITYFIANWSPKIGENKVAEGMKRSFQIWSRYSNLKFSQTDNPSADIIVAFGSGYHGDSYPFDGAGRILAHAFYPYEMLSFGGDIHFDNDEYWKENAKTLSEGVDFQSVATHELGHSLGLGHSTDFSSIMFPYYKGPESSVLGYDDVLGMHALYNQFYEPEESESTTLRSNDILTNENTYIHPTTIKSSTITMTLQQSSHSPTSSYGPVVCFDNFDTISILQGRLHIFKQEYVWELTEDFKIAKGYPKRLKEIFNGLPADVNHIDAAYERHTDNAIILFNGKHYWEFDKNTLSAGNARIINDFGFDRKTEKIDAAFVWPKNNLTYLFAGLEFTRYNEFYREVADFYPKNIGERWIGIPNNIDAVTNFPNGDTYFFKGNLYWVYNNYWIRPRYGYPTRISGKWSQCPLEAE